MPLYSFWPLNANAPACSAASMADLRATVRAWFPRSVRLTQKTNAFGGYSFYVNGNLWGHITFTA